MEPLAIVGKLNKELPVPYYYQIVQILRNAIGAHPAGEETEITLPSENELCELFHVNRGTIRHALEVLQREGLIYREKGRGTFLQRRRLELDPTTLCSTSEDLRSRGWTPGARLLGLSLITPPAHIQQRLNLSPQDTVWEIHRLRLANGEPISLQWSYLPSQLTPGLNQMDLTASLFALLKNRFGIQLKFADQTIRTRLATEEEAAFLEISERVPVFDITRVTYDQEQRPVEYLSSLWRGDRYDLRVKLALRTAIA